MASPGISFPEHLPEQRDAQQCKSRGLCDGGAENNPHASDAAINSKGDV
jgi:hypothetical protein